MVYRGLDVVMGDAPLSHAGLRMMRQLESHTPQPTGRDKVAKTITTLTQMCATGDLRSSAARPLVDSKSALRGIVGWGVEVLGSGVRPRASIEILVNVPELASGDAIGRVIHSRVIAHTSPDDPSAAPPLGAVISPTAVDRLHELYKNEPPSGLRDIIRTVHAAVTDACNGRFDTVTPELIDQAAW